MEASLSLSMAPAATRIPLTWSRSCNLADPPSSGEERRGEERRGDETRRERQDRSAVLLMEPEDTGDGVEAVAAACECCGFTEECTAPYIAGVSVRYGGRWICSLCGDAVGEELGRAAPPISPGEALDRHTAVCRARRASAPPSLEENAGDLIAAVRVVLLRRLGSSPPRRVRSTPSSPRRGGASAVLDVADAAASGGSGIARAKLLRGAGGVRRTMGPLSKGRKNLGSS